MLAVLQKSCFFLILKMTKRNLNPIKFIMTGKVFIIILNTGSICLLNE
jgi:hypothetical protein